MTIMTDNYENSILMAYQGGDAPDIVGQSIDIKIPCPLSLCVAIEDSPVSKTFSFRLAFG